MIPLIQYMIFVLLNLRCITSLLLCINKKNYSRLYHITHPYPMFCAFFSLARSFVQQRCRKIWIANRNVEIVADVSNIMFKYVSIRIIVLGEQMWSGRQTEQKTTEKLLRSLFFSQKVFHKFFIFPSLLPAQIFRFALFDLHIWDEVLMRLPKYAPHLYLFAAMNKRKNEYAKTTFGSTFSWRWSLFCCCCCCCRFGN